MTSVKKKVVIMSKKFFFNESDQFQDSGQCILDLFKRNDIIVAIVAQEKNHHILKSRVPFELKEYLKFISRSRKTWEKVNKLQRNGIIFSMVGVVSQDAIFAFQSKIPLFNPSYLRYEVDTKINDYGLPIADLQDIVDCYKAFEIHKNNYFRIDFNNNFTVISLNNANTHFRPSEEVRIKQLFKTNLKGSIFTRDHKILLLLLFHLINEIMTNDFYQDVEYWGIFPSSDPHNTTTAISFLKESVRCILGGGPRGGTELFLRIKQKSPKHLSGPKKFSDKGKEDFETLIINPQHYSRIKGSVVCIIDDYITTGYSAEVAKSLLFAAGVRKVVFISIGKFGKQYFSVDYGIQGDVSSSYSVDWIGEVEYGGYHDNGQIYNLENEQEILNFGDIL